MHWLKLYSEWASDPKVQSMSEPLQRRLIMLYCLRCQGPLEELTEREIALGLRISLPELEKTRAVFVEKGFIGEDWSLPKWEARQATSDPTAAERMRRLRDRRRSERVRDVARNGAVQTKEAEPKEEEKTGARAPSVSRNGPPDPDPTGPAPTDPAYADVARLAADLGQDHAWSEWVHRMARLEFPAEWIRDVLRKMAGKGRFTPEYATGILMSYRRQGGPDGRGAEGRPDVQPTRPEPPRLEPPRIPEGAAGAAFREMWGISAEGMKDSAEGMKDEG